jgi:hypothetical protein
VTGSVCVPRSVFDESVAQLVEIADELPSGDAVALDTKADLLKVAARLVSEAKEPQ